MQDENDSPIMASNSGANELGYDPSKLSQKYGRDTEVGRMLVQLYGKTQYKMPDLKLKTKPMEGPQPTMIGTMSRPSNVDPRKKWIDRDAIAEVEANKPPAVAVKEVHVAPIEAMKGHIRSKSVIERRERAEAASRDIKCAPIKPGRNTEREKDKLNLLFALKGGRALPEAGMSVPDDGPLPMHLITGKLGPGATARLRARAAAEVGTGPAEPTSDLYEEYKRTYEHLSKALNEARAYWDEVKSLQGGALKESQMREAAAEEDSRLAQLKKIVAEMKAEKERIVARSS